MAQSVEILQMPSGISTFRQIQKQLASQVKVPFEIKLWGEQSYHFGEGEPSFRLVVNDRTGLRALKRLDERGICEAYIQGSLDILGDMLQAVSLRGILTDQHPLHDLWRRLAPVFLGQVRTDRKAIAQHYDLDNEFYLTFMDSSRCYSHALYEQDEESLETAMQRKLDFAIEACRLQPGDRVLDVGGGWGTFTEYAGLRGIQVTSLTISRQSMQFLTNLIDRLNLPCQVINQNFLEYQSADRYDAIVGLGVMEHMPYYPAVLQRLQQLVKPGGRIYLDASAIRQKHSVPSFISSYVYPGNHSFFCLHDFLAELAKTPLELQAVYNDRHSYYLTCKAWSENLEAARQEIIDRWGEPLYRRFRLYLWGSTYAFLSKGLEAHRLVLELPRDVGERTKGEGMKDEGNPKS